MVKLLSSSLCVMLAAALLASVPQTSDARRLGGGKAAGMQRQAPAKPVDATPGTPAQPGQAAVAPKAAPAAAATGAAAAAGKRSWLGPIAGIAAGLGIAALMSHLGLGEAFGNFLTMALLAIVAFVAIRWLMGRFRQPARDRSTGPQLAGAGAPFNEPTWRDRDQPAPMQRQAMPEPMVAPISPVSPASPAAHSAGGQPLPDFDAAAFERVAKLIFVRLQAANDAGDVEDLRKFTTPELFASLRLDLQDRGGAAQQTDVVQLAAEVVETSREIDQHIVSVRFQGLIREEIGGTAEPFEEIWHLVRPADGQREWAIAGIAPVN